MDRLKELIESYAAEEERLREKWNRSARYLGRKELKTLNEQCKMVSDTLAYLKELQLKKETTAEVLRRFGLEETPNGFRMVLRHKEKGTQE